MTRTQEMETLKAELYRIRFAMQLHIRDEATYAKLKEELVIVRRNIAKLKFEELLEKREAERRGMKNG
jgi:hypothetical protein